MLAILSWLLLFVGIVKEQEDDEGLSGARLLITGVALVFGLAAALMVNFIRRRTTLRTHVEALHLLYLFERMPLTGAAHMVFQMKVKRPMAGGRIVKYSHYSVYSDGSFREDEDPVCC
ncbi:MAG: hypothetical protein HC767_08625 [Akkermansiaceae bacterium]|nr:hypothetical protein [Akkermansiaceae bacterium]